MQISVGVLVAGATAGLVLGGAALAYSPPAQDGAAQPSAVINTSRSNVKNQRAAAPGQGGACPAEGAASDPNAGCGDAAAACNHAINTKGTGAAGKHAINTKGTGAAGKHAINTKGTGATGRTAQGRDAACIAVTEQAAPTDEEK